MSLITTRVKPLAIPTTLSIRTSRVFDEDCFSVGSSTPVGSMAISDPSSKLVLDQTELVYDQLLAGRQRKLQRRIDEKRQQFEDKVNELKQSDQQKVGNHQRVA